MHLGLLDKNRRKINLRNMQVEDILPEHFAEAYPKFITLLKQYYEFESEYESTELLNHLFQARDITETDITLLSYIEDELLLGEKYLEGFPDKRAAANFSSVLFKAKGSKYSIEWFFRAFFNLDAEVVYTKENIFTLNNTESQIGPDSLRYLTDDTLYQTFALLIKVGLPQSEWKDIFKLFVHPAGMYLGSETSILGLARVYLTSIGYSEYHASDAFSLTSSGSFPDGDPIGVTATRTSPTFLGDSGETTLWYSIQHITTSDNDFVTPPPVSYRLPVDLNYISPTTSGTITLNTDSDFNVEGNQQFKVYLWENQTGGIALDSETITLVDVVATYGVSVADKVEGQDIVAVVTSTLPRGETVFWDITGDLAADTRVSNTSGSFVMSSSPVNVNIPTSILATPEGSVSGTFTVTGYGGGVTANDTFNLADAAATYELSISPNPIPAGTTGTVALEGTNIPDGTYYLDLSGGTAVSSDIVGGFTPRRAIAITGGQYATISLGIDASADDTDNFNMNLYSALTGGTLLTGPEFVEIADGSFTSYAVSVNSPVEGNDIVITIVPTNQIGEDVNWTVTSNFNGRLATTTGTATTVTTTRVINLPTTVNNLYQGSVSAHVEVSGVTSGANAQSAQFTMTDAAASYALVPSVTNLNEGAVCIYTGTGATNIQNGHTSYFFIENGTTTAADFVNPPITSARTPVDWYNNTFTQVKTTNSTTPNATNVLYINPSLSNGTKGLVPGMSSVTLGINGQIQSVTSNTVTMTQNVSLEIASGTTVSFTGVGVQVSEDMATEGTETFNGVLYSASSGGSVEATSINTTINDTSQAYTFQIATNEISSDDGGPGVPLGNAKTLFELQSDGNFIAQAIGDLISIDPLPSVDDWVTSGLQGAGFGNNYQVRVLAYENSTSRDNYPSTTNLSSLYGMTLSLGSSGTWTNSPSQWHQLNSVFRLVLQAFTSTEDGGGFESLQRYARIEIKTYTGLLGSGTTVLIKDINLLSIAESALSSGSGGVD